MKARIRFYFSILTAMTLTTVAHAMEDSMMADLSIAPVRQSYECHDNVADYTLSVSITETENQNEFVVIAGHTDFMGKFRISKAFTGMGLNKGPRLLIKDPSNKISVLIDRSKLGKANSGLFRMMDPFEQDSKTESQLFCDLRYM